MRNQKLLKNKKEDTTYIWDTAKAVLKRKFRAINTCSEKKQEGFQINSLTLQLKGTRKRSKSKASRGREIIEIRTEGKQRAEKTIEKTQ